VLLETQREFPIEAAGTARAGGRLRRAVAAATLAAAVGLSAVVATPSAAGAACATSSIGAAAAESESSFVAQLNGLRESRELPALVVNSTVASQSRDWSGVMDSQNRMHHARDTGPDDGVAPEQDYAHLISRTVPNWRRAGENVGRSGIRSWCTDAELRASVQGATDALHRAFVASPGHLQNMVGDFNQVGIGVHLTQQELWVTVRFAMGDLPKAAAPTYSKAQIATANRYTDAVHQRFLGRSATSGELSFWSSAVAGGNRGALTRALSLSDEWAGSRVAELYRTILGRDAEAAGRAGWVDAIGRGMRLEQVAAGMYGSPERFAASGSTNAGFVDGLYQDILGRPADPAGRSDWVARLDRRHLTRAQVADGFYGSVESRTDRVRSLYAEILDRAAEPAGEAHWVRQLATMGDVVLAASLASSEEFWRKATS
jgi:uncharacterized protein YkwD